MDDLNEFLDLVGGDHSLPVREAPSGRDCFGCDSKHAYNWRKWHSSDLNDENKFIVIAWYCDRCRDQRLGYGTWFHNIIGSSFG